jgi:hypothetical protein
MTRGNRLPDRKHAVVPIEVSGADFLTDLTQKFRLPLVWTVVKFERTARDSPGVCGHHETVRIIAEVRNKVSQFRIDLRRRV